jgi:hypothetical protein
MATDAGEALNHGRTLGRATIPVVSVIGCRFADPPEKDVDCLSKSRLDRHRRIPCNHRVIAQRIEANLPC